MTSDRITLNTKQLINSLEGKTRNFVEQIEKQQEENYGNYDVFSVDIYELMIEIIFGERWISYYFDAKGNITDVVGPAQGYRYENWFRQIAIELFNSKQTNL